MLWELVLGGKTEEPRHPKADYDVHWLLALLCFGPSPFGWPAITVALDGCESKAHLLAPGGGTHHVCVAGEGHIRVFADLGFLHSTGEHHSITHPVYKQAGQVKLWTLWHGGPLTCRHSQFSNPPLLTS